MAAALVFGRGTATAQNSIWYSLGDRSGVYGTGTTKGETYNVALHLQSDALVGAQVLGVRIVFPYTEGISDASAWLSRELPAVKSRKVTAPDIAQQAFTPSTAYTEVLFDAPYTVTADGLYAGYAFTTADSEDKARPVAVTGAAQPGGFFIHSTSTYRTAWRDFSAEQPALALQVLLKGDAIATDAAAVGALQELNVQTGQPDQTLFELVNHGNAGVRSIDYTITLGSYSEQRHVILPHALQGVFGSRATLSADLPAIDEKGSYTLTLQIDRVNGQPNADAERQAQTTVQAYNTLPRHRAVLEEYTGTWCGYCPRGFVGLEEMQRLHPDDFIGISYHNADPMEVITINDFPWNAQTLGSFPGYPAASLDRIAQTDAYCGFGAYTTFGIEDAWQIVSDLFAPAAVEVESQWTDSKTLTATAHVTFPVGRADCPYEVGFILVANGLTGTGNSWDQANYYGGETGWPASMDAFTQGGSTVSGLTYNFVYVARSGKAGIAGSLSAPIIDDQTQSCSYSFDIAAITNTGGQPVVQDKERLTVVALLFDKATGEIANANKCAAGGSSLATAISHVGTSRPTPATQYYDLQGRRVDHPVTGLYIVGGRKVLVK